LDDFSWLGDAFVHDANLYGRVIIEEQVQEVSAKTIAPAKVGGLAGGTKYISHVCRILRSLLN
jgi:hypothetical protein